MTLTLLIFLFPLAYSPGPGNLFFAANGARFGFWATVPANIGYHIATWFITLAVGAGLLAVFTSYPHIFTAIKVLGVTYILWLAWKLYGAGAQAGQAARVAGFWDGVVLLVLNPKAYVLMGLMYSQFGQADTLVWVATVFTLNNIVAFCLFAMLGDRVAARFARGQNGERANKVMAVMLAAVAIWMLFL
ncbi:MAG: LysE family translocator [Rhodobacteraceae bacterium]|nr:LysE family translocator [Paracoccaceae bacterium]